MARSSDGAGMFCYVNGDRVEQVMDAFAVFGFLCMVVLLTLLVMYVVRCVRRRGRKTTEMLAVPLVNAIPEPARDSSVGGWLQDGVDELDAVEESASRIKTQSFNLPQPRHRTQSVTQMPGVIYISTAAFGNQHAKRSFHLRDDCQQFESARTQGTPHSVCAAVLCKTCKRNWAPGPNIAVG